MLNRQQASNLGFVIGLIALSAFWGRALAGKLPSPAPQFNQQKTDTQANGSPQDGDFPWETFWIFCGFGATGIIAVYAIRQFGEMRRSSERQLRAYVFVDTAKVYNLDKASDRFIIVETKNFGQTPAHNARFWTGEHVREWPLASELGGAPIDLRIGVEIVPPGRKSISRIPVGELSAFEERSLRNGTVGVYFWGRITYKDVFGRPHFTNVRLVCEGDGVASGLMHTTEEGNDAD